MAAGVVSLGRYRYAVGLYWENSPGSGRIAQTAKEAASQPGQQADFYAVRPGNRNGRIPQFGLSSSDAGQKAGMPALAACLANQIPGSWAGAFRLHEGTVVIIVRDDLIVPDGDLFFTDETEARDRLIQEIGFGGLVSTYAPESWSVPSADTIPLSLLLNERHDVRLQQVQIPKQIKIAAAVIGVVILVSLAGAWYISEKEDEERAQQAETLRRMNAAKQMLPNSLQSQVAPAPKYDAKWKSAPPALAVIESCRQGLGQVPAARVGWHISGLRCAGGNIALTWSRDKGYSVPPPGATINETASSGTQTIALSHLEPRGEEALADQEEITRRYLAQNWPGSINRAPDDPLPSPPPEYKGPWNPPPAPWVKRSFTFAVPELPGNVPGWIGGLPGVVINNMNFSFNGISGTWSIEGVIYENRE